MVQLKDCLTIAGLYDAAFGCLQRTLLSLLVCVASAM